MVRKLAVSFAPVRQKMQDAGLDDLLISSFEHYYTQLVAGATGYIPGAEAHPPAHVLDKSALVGFHAIGSDALKRLVVVKLNGGLGTSMGLNGPRSLLMVKDGLRFLDIIVRHVLHIRQQTMTRLPLIFMNSYSTQEATHQALTAYPELIGDLPLGFLQNKVPKICQDSLAPVEWHEDPAKEWCPPGHGDMYLALHSGQLLKQMLALGYEYMFVSNADNLGATVETDILGFFAAQNLPFLMEVTGRTAADRKGGHLAQGANGRLLLREIAQCPPEEIGQFQDIRRYRLFNTNNLWIHLPSLQRALDERDGFLDLPMIRNSKPVDPLRPDSPPVFQLETAVGLAISAFDGAQAIQVPRDRFLPVKRCNDLLALRSDAYRLNRQQRVDLDPRRGTGPFPAGAPHVELDDRFYQFIDQIQERFPHGPPSLIGCRSFTVKGPYTFGAAVTVAGDVALTNGSDRPIAIPDDAILAEQGLDDRRSLPYPAVGTTQRYFCERHDRGADN